MDLAPLAGSERIQALDVVRGFALIGIFLMNIEYFNRALGEIEYGMPTTLTGIDWLAGWLVYNFVQGKFWTMFSLLFGMGFAVMLNRAERAGRSFLRPYLRRIAGLAVFGVLHYIFIWGGDILTSYAVAAAGLLIMFYGNWKYVVAALLLFIGLGFVPGMDPAHEVAGGLACISIAAFFLRQKPVPARQLRIGVVMYLLFLVLLTAAGAGQYFSAPESQAAAATSEDSAEQKEREQERLEERQKAQAEIAEERRIMSTGSYREAVRLRARAFVESAGSQALLATLIIGMFLIGGWFVRSGVMENTAAHLPLFRRLALYGTPFGVGLGLLASSLATSSTPNMENDPHMMAMGMMAIGNLPACLGYVSLIVLMLHSRTALARIEVLAPLGRMALTNYLTHSIIGTWFFYGYGLGYWGLGRAWQVLFVALVIVLQILFCHWWLARFRYGPMEWLWRAITYWQLPPMRYSPRMISNYNAGHE